MDSAEVGLILFLISCAGFIFSIVYLIISLLKKNDKKSLCFKLIGGFIILIILSMTLPTFSGMGNSNIDLSREEKKVLKKNYSALTENEKIRLASLEVRLTGKDREKYKKDLKRLFIQHHVSLGMSESESEKFWNNQEDYKGRKESGQLTEKEKEQQKQNEKNAQEFNNRVKDYMEAEKIIQQNLDKLISSDKRFIDSTDKVTVKEESNEEKIIVTVNIYGIYDLRVGEVAAIRNIMVDEVQKKIKPKKIEVNFKTNNKNLDSYVFKEGTGWDKEVQSKK